MHKLTKLLKNIQTSIRSKINYRQKYLFLFSHMRSRSSLLSHILGSNPEICGYSELHIFYKNKTMLEKMKEELLKEHRYLRKQYLFDKIVNNFDFSNDIFTDSNSKYIFLLRKPESSFKSIINMGDLTGVNWYKDPKQVANYYISRLMTLEELSKHAKGNYFFIESDEIIEKTKSTLDNLSTWLELKQPLNTEYTIFKNTGKPKFGDPSDKIKSGRIIKTNEHNEILIPKEILEQGQIHYERCKKILSSNAVNFTLNS